MTTLPQPIVNYEEPPELPPPLLAVGPLAWVQKNLFSTPFDSLLTIAGVGLVVGAVIGFLGWAIGQANWFAITFNLRQFMLGRYEPSAEWRVTLLTLFAMLTIGLSLWAWARLTRGLLIAIVIILALIFILPPVIAATMPMPATYFAAGSTPIVTGADTLTPQPELAFTGQAGEVISVQIAADLTASDEILSGLSGFGDDAANALRNAATNRLNTAARIVEIQNLLAGDLLTANQRTVLQTELDRLTVPDPITDTYALNQPVAVDIEIRRGPTGEVLLSETLESNGTPLTLTLPEDGWYVLKKTVTTEGADAVIRTQGIYPILERNVTRSGEVVEGQAVSAAERVVQYTRLTDLFTTEELRPVDAESRNLPTTTIINNQYRGVKPFGEYLRLFVGPFLSQINVAVLVLVVTVLVGYGAGMVLDRLRPGKLSPKATSGRIAMWMWFVGPVLMFILVYGLGNVLPLTDTRRWGGLLLTIMLSAVGIIASFPIGILLALGRRSSLPIISLLSTLYIEFVRGVPLITVLFMAQLLVPLVNPTLAETPNVFRAMVGIILFSAAYLAENVRGGLQSIPPGQEEAAKALGLSGIQITLQITLPQALRAVLPALVGQFISLFKDTSLVAIVGLLDFSAMGELVVAQTEFLGLRREVYVFLIVFYFAFCYAIASISRRIESSGAGKALARKI